jgi:tripeptidyl-peptidase-1
MLIEFIRLYQFIVPNKRLQKEGSPITLADALDYFFAGVDESYCTSDKVNGNEECGVWSPARVTSISYGVGEVFLPKATQERQCNEFMKLALQGHTFTVASGDYGVASQPLGTTTGGNGCIVPGNFKASTGPHETGSTQNGTVFSPGYPQNCPYVLSIGATQLLAHHDEESAMNLPGVSTLFTPAIFSSSG